VFSEWLAKDAANATRLAGSAFSVREFRAHVLGGKTLEPDDARRFQNSIAVRLMPRHWFEEHNISPVAHTATLIEYIEDSRAAELGHFRARLSIEASGVAIPVEHTGSPVAQFAAAFAGVDDAWIKANMVWTESLLAELHTLSAALIRSFPVWEGQEQDVSWFVLTGQVPQIRPLLMRWSMYRGSDYNRATITMTIEPWMPADAVRKAYQDLQRRMLGRDNRPLSKRTLALLQFMGKQREIHRARPTWRALCAWWNDAYPEWRCVTSDGQVDERRFRRDYMRAFEAVMYPAYE
jgi:hypothetical protein